MTKERFEYDSFGGWIHDDLTGMKYRRLSEITNLLNDENERANRVAEQFFPFYLVLKKYGITDAEKLDACLREGRVW